MAVFFSSYDRRDLLKVPQFNRMRHRYRGPRESQKINLEIGQMHFSIHKLYDKYRKIQLKFIEVGQELFEGGEVQGVTDSSDEPLELLGLISLRSKVQRMNNRLRNLEQ